MHQYKNEIVFCSLGDKHDKKDDKKYSVDKAKDKEQDKGRKKDAAPVESSLKKRKSLLIYVFLHAAGERRGRVVRTNVTDASAEPFSSADE